MIKVMGLETSNKIVHKPNRQIAGQIDSQIERQIDRKIDRQKYRWKDGHYIL